MDLFLAYVVKKVQSLVTLWLQDNPPFGGLSDLKNYPFIRQNLLRVTLDSKSRSETGRH